MPLSVQALISVGCERERAEAHLPVMTAAMDAHDITTAPRARAFVAQALWECGCLRWMEEIWGPTPAQRGYEGRGDLGNLARGDGFRYRGRGPFMLTGRVNYRAYGAKLKTRYESEPDLVAKPPDGWLVAARYWQEKGLNELADQMLIRDITRRINGAATDGDPSHHLKRMALHRALPLDCTPSAIDPYLHLTPLERRKVEALDAERRSAGRHGGWKGIGGAHLVRAVRLKAELERQRKRIWRAAQAEPGGWEKHHRRERFAILKEKTAERPAAPPSPSP